MKTIAIIIAALSVAGSARAEKKPVVCLNYVEATMPVDGAPAKVAICSDGKRPEVLTSITLVTIRQEDGSSVKAVIGYR